MSNKLNIGVIALDQITEKGIPFGDFSNVCIIGATQGIDKSYFVQSINFSNINKTNERTIKKK